MLLHQTRTDGEDTCVLEIAALARRCAREMVHRDVADDLVQDIVLECLDKMRCGRWVEPASVGGLVRQMVRRRAIDVHRRSTYRAKRDALHLQDMMQAVRDWMDPTSAVEEEEMTVLRATVLDALPEDCRRAFVMVREEELPYQVAAERLGLTRAGICAHVVSAQKRLRMQLRECGIAAPPPNTARMRSKKKSAVQAVNR